MAGVSKKRFKRVKRIRGGKATERERQGQSYMREIER